MSDSIREKFKEILEYYDKNPFLSLIPILNFIQDEEGFISKERIKEISEFLGIKELNEKI